MAWRNIWRNKTRSLVILGSVAIGLMAGLFVVSLFLGMVEGRVKTLILDETGHLQLHRKSFIDDFEPGFYIPAAYKLRNYLKQDNRVKASCFRSVTQGMVATATGTAGVQLNGISLAEENLVSGLDKKIIEGPGFQDEKKWQVIISRRLAKKLKLKNGNKLVATFTDTSGALVSAAFRVAAVYETSNAPRDEINIYVRREELNLLLGIPSQMHEVTLLLRDDIFLEDIIRDLQLQFHELQVDSWKDLSPETELLINTVDVYSYFIILIILLALSFGIVNAMLMAVLERIREIGMMTALGLNRVRLSVLIGVETIILTLAGSPLGIIIAWILISYYKVHGITWYKVNKEVMSRFGFSTTLYPEYPFHQLFPILLFVFITALLAGIYPVWKALRLQPVDALRK